MEEPIGTPLHVNDWWLVPVVAAEGAASVRIELGTVDRYRAPPREGSLWHRAFGVHRKRPQTRQVTLIVSRVEARDGQRAEAVHRIVIEEQDGQLVGTFLGSPPHVDIVAQLRGAVLDCLENAIGGADSSRGSNWRIDQLLAALTGFDRTDDGTDELSLRIGVRSTQRTMYVHLYGGDVSLIDFDLEDAARAPSSWDHRVSSGAVKDIEALRVMAEAWLVRGRLPAAAPPSDRE